MLMWFVGDDRHGERSAETKCIVLSCARRTGAEKTVSFLLLLFKNKNKIKWSNEKLNELHMSQTQPIWNCYTEICIVIVSWRWVCSVDCVGRQEVVVMSASSFAHSWNLQRYCWCVIIASNIFAFVWAFASFIPADIRRMVCWNATMLRARQRDYVNIQPIVND